VLRIASKNLLTQRSLLSTYDWVYEAVQLIIKEAPIAVFSHVNELKVLPEIRQRREGSGDHTIARR
jgi:hypothetical protein